MWGALVQVSPLRLEGVVWCLIHPFAIIDRSRSSKSRHVKLYLHPGGEVFLQQSPFILPYLAVWINPVNSLQIYYVWIRISAAQPVILVQHPSDITHSLMLHSECLLSPCECGIDSPGSIRHGEMISGRKEQAKGPLSLIIHDDVIRKLKVYIQFRKQIFISNNIFQFYSFYTIIS